MYISKFFSSGDEFDEPIREYLEKTLSESNKNKNKNSSTISSASNAFENEMEDELDQIYHNFISRGTFELPISSEYFLSLNFYYYYYSFLFFSF